MNLHEFVKTALLEIIGGVSEARAEAEKLDAVIGSDPAYGPATATKVLTHSDGRTFSVVEFDVALAHASGTSTKGGIGVFLGTVGLGSQGATHGEATSTSR